MTIGENIKALRQLRKLSQKELANRLGVSQAAISQFEKNTSIPKLETIKKIAITLEIPYTDLLEYKETRGHVAAKVCDGLFVAKDKNKLESFINNANDRKKKINYLMDQLNETGQDKAIDHLEMLSKIDDYTK